MIHAPSFPVSNVNVITPIKLIKRCNINLFTKVDSNKFYNLQNNTISEIYLIFNENMSNAFNLRKDLKAELVLNYYSTSVDQFGETFALFSNISIGLQKQF